MIEKETFEKETGMCRELSRKKGGRCNWGECSKCGVIPLLHKLYKSEVVESEEEIKNLKDEILCQK
ncbi:MAG: hypothetical protein HGB08_03800 [Candidatus Moranbacteria bacterium]|nr:hypothetical protein [Candidatus Moranbacteria bacterium]